MSVSISLILIFLCLLVEGFFSGSELALVSINRFLLKNKADAGSVKAKKIINLLKKSSELVIVTLLGTNFCTVTMSSIATLLIINTYGHSKAYLATLLILPLTLIFGELIPKKLGQKYSESISEKIINPLSFIRIIFYPLIFLLVRYTNVLANILNLKDTQRNFVASRDELRHSLDELDLNPDTEDEEIALIENALDLNDIYTEDCMVPLFRVDALSTDDDLSTAIKLINEKGHSRVPVYKDRIDNIVGIIYSFDILKNDIFNIKVASVMSETIYVPITQPVDSLIKLFRVSGQHMAVVVDEYGGAVGIITLDDILEEVVGALDDEFDDPAEEDTIKKLSENIYLVKADTEIDDLIMTNSIKIPEGDYTSIGGYLLDLFEKIPKIGEKIEDNSNIYFISKATNRKIEEIILSKKE